MTDKDINASIDYILDKGLVKPPTVWERITHMHSFLGWRFIFWDKGYGLVFAAVTLLGIGFLLRYEPFDYRYSAAVALSPVLFLLIMLFAEMNERACSLFELKQTCRFTSRQVTALRCICYSIIGAGFAAAVTVFFAESTAQFFRLLPLCLGGLFICAAVELSVIRWFRSRWAIAIFSAGWIFANLTLPLAFSQAWETLLAGLPLALTTAAAIAGAAAFMYQLNKMLMEENNYAIA